MDTYADPAMVNSGYERIADDFYPTPEWITHLICDYVEEHFPQVENVLEPACGKGHMSRVMEGRGFNVDSYDLVDRGYGLHGVNFLTHNYDNLSYDAIITNPPYGELAGKFIERGLNLIAGENRVMAMVLRNEYDSAKTRRKFFADCPYYYGKLVLTQRPVWIEKKPGEKSASPRHNYAVFFYFGQHADWGMTFEPGNVPPIISYADASTILSRA